MSRGSIVLVETTFPDREIAEKVARLLVDGGLAVCGQVGADLVSFYNWEDSVHRDNEVAVVFKVLPERMDLFTGELKLQHPYRIPQIISWPSSYVNEDYLNWARGKLK